MLTYPDCESCPCKTTPNGESAVGTEEDPKPIEQPQVLASDLAAVNSSVLYDEIECGNNDVEYEFLNQVYSGYDEGIPDGLDVKSDALWFKTPLYYETDEMSNVNSDSWRATDTISMGQSLNLLNQRSRYFSRYFFGNNPNRITTTITNDEFEYFRVMLMVEILLLICP
jgi:hypothetical protein